MQGDQKKHYFKKLSLKFPCLIEFQETVFCEFGEFSKSLHKAYKKYEKYMYGLVM